MSYTGGYLTKTVCIIPARYNSSRFPGKPLALISGKPMIEWVYKNVSKSGLLDEIYVATDDQRIFDCVEAFGGKVLMTDTRHTCGTDRITECVRILGLENDDIVLNVQGDEPLVDEGMISDLQSAFSDETVYMGTLKKKIENNEELSNPNVVKVITDVHNNAIYFSRFCLPYERNNHQAAHYKHIGMYGYKVGFLKKFSSMPKTELETAESLEQLRAIENGYKIRVVETTYQTIGIDTPEQIYLAEEEIAKRGLI